MWWWIWLGLGGGGWPKVTCRLGLTATLWICGPKQSTVIIYEVARYLNATSHYYTERHCRMVWHSCFEMSQARISIWRLAVMRISGDFLSRCRQIPGSYHKLGHHIPSTFFFPHFTSYCCILIECGISETYLNFSLIFVFSSAGTPVRF